MITNSFVFLEKISAQKEKKFWQQGILDWNGFPKTEKIKGITPLKKSYYNRKIQEAQQALLQGESAYFVGKLPPKHRWRLYAHFKDECGSPELIRKEALRQGLRKKTIETYCYCVEKFFRICRKEIEPLELRPLLGHSRLDTTMMYVHTAAQQLLKVQSPLYTLPLSTTSSDS